MRIEIPPGVPNSIRIFAVAVRDRLSVQERDITSLQLLGGKLEAITRSVEDVRARLPQDRGYGLETMEWRATAASFTILSSQFGKLHYIGFSSASKVVTLAVPLKGAWVAIMNPASDSYTVKDDLGNTLCTLAQNCMCFIRAYENISYVPVWPTKVETWNANGTLTLGLPLPIGSGGTGLSSLGTANQLLGVNNGATAQEYKTLSGTTNQITVTHGVGTVTLSLPSDVIITSSGLAASTTQGIGLSNATAATGGVTIQYSPALDFIGHGWNSLFSSDRTSRFRVENRPTSGSSPAAVLTFLSSVDTGTASWTSRATLDSAGVFTAASLVGSSGITNSSLTSGRVVYSSTAGLQVDSANMTFNGNRLALAATGSSGGILAGGDVQLYRVSADVWYTPDTLQIVPANFSLASAAGYAILATATGAPSGSTGQRVFGLSFTAVASTNFNYTDATGGMTGLQSALSHTGSGTITAAACGIFSGSSGSTGTITNFNQVYALGWDVSSGSNVTTWNGFRSDTPRASGAGVVTTAYAFVSHPRTMTGTITNLYGMGIFPAGNMNAHSHNGETRVGIAIGGMPSPGAFTTPTTIALWLSVNADPTTARDGIYWGSSKDTNLYRSAASTLKTDGTLLATAAITSSGATSGIGYATGAGGTVTQATSKSTGATLSKVTGQVTMNNAALAAGAIVSFTLTNTAIAATDVVIVNIGSAASADSYTVMVTAVGSGSCRIQVQNISAGSLSEALVLNFAVIKGVTS